MTREGSMKGEGRREKMTPLKAWKKGGKRKRVRLRIMTSGENFAFSYRPNVKGTRYSTRCG